MSDRIEEISEDLEADFGKPYNVSEDNFKHKYTLDQAYRLFEGIFCLQDQKSHSDAFRSRHI